jgi:hypothetical protein
MPKKHGVGSPEYLIVQRDDGLFAIGWHDDAAGPFPYPPPRLFAKIDLHIGRRYTGVSVRPDFEWPGMWHVHQDDRASDMVNLSRAKDAAISWARPRGLGSSEVARWHHRETAPGGVYGAFSEETAIAPSVLLPSPPEQQPKKPAETELGSAGAAKLSGFQT